MTFERFHLNPALMKALKHLGFEEPTDIQEKGIPLILQNKDVVGQSSTGSGKTAAFGLPILQRVMAGQGVQSLILTPTRELCVQVTQALNDFAKFTPLKATGVFGGVGMQPQIEAVARVEIVVGTPGRILDHLSRGTLDLRGVKYLVLDEADKMFEMGFVEDVEEIIRHVPHQRQTLLFSATMPATIQTLIHRHLKEPEFVESELYVDKSLLKQAYYEVDSREKFSLLVHLLKTHSSRMSMVFCATRREVDVVARNLKANGIHAMAIHGGLTQNKRLQALEALRKQHINVLVATDVAARGLDVRNVTHVYNYDVPKTSDEYLHRVGRTARAGDSGDAVTLLTERDHLNFRAVLRDPSLDIRKMEMPAIGHVPFSRHHEQRGRGYGGERRGFGGHGRTFGRGGYSGGREGGHSGPYGRPERWGGRRPQHRWNE